MADLTEFITRLPKCEMHLHIEGTLEPELKFAIAARNNITLSYADAAQMRAASSFHDLPSFLTIYYEGMSMLLTEADFYDLAWAYLTKAREQNIRYAEIFFDPQAHTSRGIAFKTVLDGISRALEDGRNRLGLGTRLIMCFLRDREATEAMGTLEQALPHRGWIIGVGLDSAEKGNPPAKFRRVFERARALGFQTVAHAGEEGPASYVREALDLLHVARIDHGIRALDDPGLVARLARERVPLTVCPLSNVRLRVVDDIRRHPLRKMIENGLIVTVNSDDPAYFGGYVNENFAAAQEGLSLWDEDLAQLARNSFEAAFLPPEEKQALVRRVDEYVAAA